jgi:hypothetical protein
MSKYKKCAIQEIKRNNNEEIIFICRYYVHNNVKYKPVIEEVGRKRVWYVVCTYNCDALFYDTGISRVRREIDWFVGQIAHFGHLKRMTQIASSIRPTVVHHYRRTRGCGERCPPFLVKFWSS